MCSLCSDLMWLTTSQWDARTTIQKPGNTIQARGSTATTTLPGQMNGMANSMVWPAPPPAAPLPSLPPLANQQSPATPSKLRARAGATSNSQPSIASGAVAAAACVWLTAAQQWIFGCVRRGAEGGKGRPAHDQRATVAAAKAGEKGWRRVRPKRSEPQTRSTWPDRGALGVTRSTCELLGATVMLAMLEAMQAGLLESTTSRLAELTPKACMYAKITARLEGSDGSNSARQHAPPRHGAATRQRAKSRSRRRPRLPPTATRSTGKHSVECIVGFYSGSPVMDARGWRLVSF